MRVKYFGVVEGFYGTPYSFTERIDLIKFLSRIRLNTYVYGPKNDPYHRKSWPKLYPESRLRQFICLNQLSIESNVHFNYALSPMNDPEFKTIQAKIQQLIEIGIKNFSLFYDDIKVELDQSTAEKQANSANMLYLYLKKKMADPVLFFCPTQYRGFPRSRYMQTLTRRLLKPIEMFWTGNRVVSKRITAAHIARIARIFKRPPLIWDNLFANDYIPGQIWRHPYKNRSASLVDMTRGVLINPMNEYRLSKPLIHSASFFFADSKRYSPTKVWDNIRKYNYKKKGGF